MGRVAIIVYPDWPVIAAGFSPNQSAAITQKSRIYSSSLAAQQHGVTRGISIGQARALCSDLQLHPANLRVEHEQFRIVAEHCTQATPFVHVMQPGMLRIASRHLPRDTNEENPFLLAVEDALAEALSALRPPVDCRNHRPYMIGVADSIFPAIVAAHQTGDRHFHYVDPGTDISFLRTQRIDVLALLPLYRTDMPPVQLLEQLIADCHAVGIHTCAAFVSLPRSAIVDRFGAVARPILDLLTGLTSPSPSTPHLPKQRRFAATFTPALNDISAVVFASRRMFDTVIDTLRNDGRACTKVHVEIVTEENACYSMPWQARNFFTVEMLQERLRWQLEGRRALASTSSSDGVCEVAVFVEQTIVVKEQSTLLPDGTDTTRHALLDTAASRISGILGEHALVQPYRSSGRHPSEWIHIQPWMPNRQMPLPAPTMWVNQLPSPAPATLFRYPEKILVQDSAGNQVVITGRGMLSTTPQKMRFPNGSWQQIVTFAGPWLANERWWLPQPHRAARFQFVTDTGDAYLTAQRSGSWFVEALYD